MNKSVKEAKNVKKESDPVASEAEQAGISNILLFKRKAKTQGEKTVFESKDEHDYKVEFAIFEQFGKSVRKAIITDNSLPHIELTDWLSYIETDRPKTRERYAYAILSYIRYFDRRSIHYKNVTKKRQIKTYIQHFVHMLDQNIVTQEPQKSWKTVVNSLSVIASFCDFLEDEHPEYKSPFRKYEYQTRDENAKRVVHRYSGLGLPKMRFKAKRSYRKWYTSDEIEALSSNFLTLRDKCVFLISINAGCRIDEILNIKKEDYNSEERQIWIEKSKTIPRFVTLDQETCNELDRYIQTEWQETETKSGRVLDFMFVNLRRGEIGKQVSYRNMYGILKACAERAGMDPLKVIFHAGRSTKAQEVLETQVLNPELGITDALVMEIFGWSNMSSILPYKKEFNAKIAKAASDKIFERRRKKQ